MAIGDISTEQLLQMRQQNQQASQPAQPQGDSIQSISTEDLLQMSQQSSPSSLALIQSLSGKLPSQGELPPQTAQAFGTTFRDVGFRRRGRPVENPEFKKEVERRDAFAELSKQYDPEQIQTVLDIQKRLNPGLVQSLKNNSGQLTGGLAGAAIGAKTALAVGQIPPLTALPEELITVPLFAAGGAFLGGGGGKIAQQAIDPLESPSARAFLRAGTEEAVAEGVGRFASLGARGLFGKKSVEAVETAKQRFKLSDGFFQPAQRDERVLVKAADALAGGSFGGGPVMAGHNLAQQGQAVEILQDITKKMAGGAVDDPAVLGSEMAGVFTRFGEKGQKVKGVRQTLLDTWFDDLYGQVDELSPGAEFTTAPIIKLFEKKLAENAKQGGALLTSEGVSRAEKAIATLAKTKTAKEMRQLRSLYVKDARRFQIAGDQSTAIFKEAAGTADRILFDEGSQAGLTEPGRKMLRNINAVYGPGKELFDESFVKEVVRKLNIKPGGVTSLIGKKPDPKNIRVIKEILLNPVRTTSGSGATSKTVAKELQALKAATKNPAVLDMLSKNTEDGKRLWKQLKANWLTEAVTDPKTGLIDVNRMDKAVKGMDKKSFNIMFGGELGKDVKALNGLVDAISQKKGGLTSLFGKGIEFGGAERLTRGIATGNGISVAAGGTMILAPSAYARIATNKSLTNVLTLGLKRQAAQKAKGKAFNVAALAGKLSNMMMKEDAADQRAIIKQRDKTLGQAKGRRVEGLRKQALQLGARDE